MTEAKIDDLKAAIDAVGRDRVFARARAYGWDRSTTPPAYVWWGIVHELRQNIPPPARQRGGLLDALGLGGIF